jgi:hypothetical protein
MTLCKLTALALGVAVAGTMSMVPGTRNASAQALPPNCKWHSFTLENGKSLNKASCKWKYGCDCRVVMCNMSGRWKARGTANCINLPG